MFKLKDYPEPISDGETRENNDKHKKSPRQLPIKSLGRNLALGASLLLGSNTMAQETGPFFSQDKAIENHILQKTSQPEDYDLTKTARLNLDRLKEKRNLDMTVIPEIMLESFEKSREFKHRLEESGDSGQNEKASLSNLTELEKEYLKNAPMIFTEIESARSRVMELIGSDGYLKKLQEEFDCSLEEAKEHQRVRLSNVQLTNYIITSQEEIADIYQKENRDTSELSKQILCYDSKYDNLIYLPYDWEDYANLLDQNQFSFDIKELKLGSAAMHEFLHKSTRRNLGLSPKAIKLLGEGYVHTSETENAGDAERWTEYYRIPTERYARLKMFELDLERLGVKKIGEQFTGEHCKKLYDLYINKKFGIDAIEFMDFTDYEQGEAKNIIEKEKYELFFNFYQKLFNEIASLDGNSNKSGTSVSSPDHNIDYLA